MSILCPTYLKFVKNFALFVQKGLFNRKNFFNWKENYFEEKGREFVNLDLKWWTFPALERYPASHSKKSISKQFPKKRESFRKS